ncbi:penicillin-binding protein, partial [Clostridium perfringens]
QLPPGSTFKPLTAVAGLMEGVVKPGEVMNDTSGTWSKEELKGMTLKNFEGVANGPTDLRTALELSSNYYFYELGYRLYKNSGGDVSGGNLEALDTLAKYAWKFGFGVDPAEQDTKSLSTGIQIEENFGKVYNFKSWKDKIVN